MKKKYTVFALVVFFVLSVFYFRKAFNQTAGEVMLEQVPSNDHVKLEKIVNIGEGYADLKWELFGTPEWSGGVPGPSDYATIITVGKIINMDAVPPGNAGEPYYFLPPNSNRHWLNSEQSSIISFLINGNNPAPPVECLARTLKSSSNDKAFDAIECRYGREFVMAIFIMQPS